MANLVYSDEDQEKIDSIKDIYQKTVPEKIRIILRHSIIFNIFRCSMVAHEKTFFPEKERKCFIRRLLDNYAWYFKYHKVCLFYNRFGLDIKNWRKMKDYLDFSYVKKDRAKVHHKGHSLEKVRKDNINVRYSIIADNKIVFYNYVEKMFPKCVPNTVFAFCGNKVIMPFDDSIDTIKKI